MACLEFNFPAIPTLPTGFSFAPPPLPSFSGDLTLCCKLVDFSISIPIPIPAATLNVGFLVAVNAAIQAANAWMDLYPLSCPRE